MRPYGEIQRMGMKLDNCVVIHHTRTSEIRLKGWRKSIKRSVDTASAERKSNRGGGGFQKTEKFFTLRVDKRPKQGVEGKAPLIVSKQDT